MQLFTFVGLWLSVTAVFGNLKKEDDPDWMLKVEGRRDVFNISNDLMHMNRQNELPKNVEKDNILRLFVIGDHGSYFNLRALTSATEAMNNLALQYEYDHIITVGDNFYWNGIESINNRWKAWLVMTAFKKNALKNLLIYPTIGNHDCHVDMLNEVRFSKYDYQWRLEQEYYVKVTPLKDNPEKNFVINY